MIENAVRGFSVSDEEVGKILLYTKFAKVFGFTPKEVDELDVVVMQGMSYAYDAIMRERERMVKKNA